jgi:hypothetical protein
MCKCYKKDTCSNQFCTFALEGDGYTKLVLFPRLQQEHSGLSPLVTKANRDAEARKVVDREGKAERAYDRLFMTFGTENGRGARMTMMQRSRKEMKLVYPEAIHILIVFFVS